jgi:aldehyde dehydrogenase (NAD+)
MYVNGQWQTPAGTGVAEIVNPATEEVVAKVSLGNEADIDTAVQAARAAFDSWSQTPAAERADFLDKIVAGLEARTDDLADAITSEMGIPVMLCKGSQLVILYLPSRKRLSWRVTMNLKQTTVAPMWCVRQLVFAV